MSEATEYAPAARGDAAVSLSQRPQDARRAPSQTALALRDIVNGARLWYAWGILGAHDIRQRYRRSKIGPFWITISMGLMIGALGGLYTGLFRTNVASYLPHVAVGIVVWNFIAALVNEGSRAFIDGQASIKQERLPLSIHVYRMVWRNLIVFAHNLVIIVVVNFAFSVRPGWGVVLVIPALALLCLNGMWVGLLFGLLSARFRDVPQIVANVLQLAFFLTPIIWQPDLLPERAPIMTFNPFFHAIEIVRAPLLGERLPLESWLAMILLTFLGAAAALALYARYRRRIAYWV
jgi:ABC-2 type transport system permease protein/lipopolysaccharide transport system permease protein